MILNSRNMASCDVSRVFITAMTRFNSEAISIWRSRTMFSATPETPVGQLRMRTRERAPEDSLIRALWCTIQFGVGVAGIFAAQIWAFVLIAPNSEHISAKDLILSARLWGMTFRRLPETHLKYLVGVVLSSFGVFFAAEGMGVHWPLGDAALLYVAATLFAISQAQIRALVAPDATGAEA